MSPDETQRLAAAIAALRPDWPPQSLRTFIAGQLAARAYRDAALALVWVALDAETKTPARVLEAGPWWGTSRVATSDADRHPSATPYPDLCQTHGQHRDHCGCDPQAYAARLRETAAERNKRNADRAREALRAGQQEVAQPPLMPPLEPPPTTTDQEATTP